MVRQYVTYTCVNCKKQAQRKSHTGFMSYGNPLFTCPHCGTTNYDTLVYEPALLDPQELVKDAHKRIDNESSISYFLGGLAGFFLPLALLGNVVIGIAAAIVILALISSSNNGKKKKITAAAFSNEINQSLARLNSDKAYADLVIKRQGNHPNSAWSRQNKL